MRIIYFPKQYGKLFGFLFGKHDVFIIHKKGGAQPLLLYS